MRGDYYRKNRSAAYWRAVAIKLLRLSGSSFRDIADYYLISPERARQIFNAPEPPAQLSLNLSTDLAKEQP